MLRYGKTLEEEKGLRREVELACGVDLGLCYECGKCSGGCSTGHHYDFTPRKIIQLVRLGKEDMLLNMDALSICVSCRLCVERCPSGIDIPGIIDYLRERALRQGVPPKRAKVELFNTLFLEEISRRGRVSELSLMARFKLKTSDLTSDAATGMRLFLKGKLKLLTPRVRGLSEIKKSLGER
jgi:heterodisulfide reductase subunit C